MFYPIQIPTIPGFGWEATSEFNTLITSLRNGSEDRNGEWDVMRQSYSPPYNNIPAEQFMYIKRMHLGMRGSLHTFLHLDRLDHELDNEPFGEPDGVKTQFQLTKLYDPGGGASYIRIIDKPAPGLVFRVNGVITAASYSQTTGLVTFSPAPADDAVLTASGTYFVHVRFMSDKLTFSIDNKSGNRFITNGSSDLIEVILES